MSKQQQLQPPETRFRVVRIQVAWEVIEEDAEGRFLASHGGRGEAITEGDPEGKGRSMGERLDAALPAYCLQALAEKEPAGEV